MKPTGNRLHWRETVCECMHRNEIMLTICTATGVVLWKDVGVSVCPDPPKRQLGYKRAASSSRAKRDQVGRALTKIAKRTNKKYLTVCLPNQIIFVQMFSAKFCCLTCISTSLQCIESMDTVLTKVTPEQTIKYQGMPIPPTYATKIVEAARALQEFYSLNASEVYMFIYIVYGKYKS